MLKKFLFFVWRLSFIIPAPPTKSYKEKCADLGSFATATVFLIIFVFLLIFANQFLMATFVHARYQRPILFFSVGLILFIIFSHFFRSQFKKYLQEFEDKMKKKDDKSLGQNSKK